jgi:hypothetical protein
MDGMEGPRPLAPPQLSSRISAAARQFEDMRERLRVALEDCGQQTILRYVEGDQIPQRKADFLLGGEYFEEA